MTMPSFGGWLCKSTKLQLEIDIVILIRRTNEVNIVSMMRKEQLAEAGRKLFLANGVDGMTMRAVADAVGVSATAIYRHFKNKDELLRAVVFMGRERFTLYLTRGLGGSTPLERLRKTGEAYLDFAFDQPEDYRIMFLAWDRLDMETCSKLGENQQTPMLQFFLDRVREVLPPERGQSPKEVLRVALFFWAQVHGIASLYLTGGGARMFGKAEFREMAHAQVQTLIDLWSAKHGDVPQDVVHQGGRDEQATRT